MFIEPAIPVAFSYIGQRAVNQDRVYPAVGQATDQSQLFIVCDGMGGADKGEIASQLLCEALVTYATSENQQFADTTQLSAALALAYQAYDNYLKQHPFVSRMGSTLALLQFHEQGATVAHIGDSRVYQLRNGAIIFQTQDHKQVNDMVEAGIITATQAITHPWRNRLSRAVVASAGTDDTVSAKPDVTCLTDIQAGDYFFLCTDGVLEQVDNYVLETILAQSIPDQAKVQAILSLCAGQTKDNYSGYLIGINQVRETNALRTSILPERW
jgi:protein phosphatase